MDNKEFIEDIQRRFEELQKNYDVNLDELDDSELMSFLENDFQEMDNYMLQASKTKNLLVKKIHKDAILPKYNFPSDSGCDLHSTEEIIIPAFGRVLVPTGLVFQFDEGLEIQIRPKSGLAIKQGLTVLNTPGTVDQGYTGEIQVILFNTNNHEVTITKGMKIAQAVLCPVINGKYVNLQEVEELEDRDRGEKGFGSTGI
jgi:dUTP pyrophosphatase